jgi:hypothetical protein
MGDKWHSTVELSGRGAIKRGLEKPVELGFGDVFH